QRRAPKCGARSSRWAIRSRSHSGRPALSPRSGSTARMAPCGAQRATSARTTGSAGNRPGRSDHLAQHAERNSDREEAELDVVAAVREVGVPAAFRRQADAAATGADADTRPRGVAAERRAAAEVINAEADERVRLDD